MAVVGTTGSLATLLNQPDDRIRIRLASAQYDHGEQSLLEFCLPMLHIIQTLGRHTSPWSLYVHQYTVCI